MKPGIQKVNVVSLRLASLWKLNLNLSKHLNIQAFIQAVLMSGRRHKKLNLLIDFWNSIFMKFYFIAYWHWTCIQNKLAYKFPSILNYFFVPQMWKKKKTDNNKTAWTNAWYSIYVHSTAGRNLIFCFNIQATQPRKCFSTYPWPSTWQVSIPITNFIFLVGFLFFSCHSKMPKTPKMLMKDKYWCIMHGYLKVILFFL